jgi:prepilin-type N-terminal cleavage/methylation domain-containing protein
MHRPTSDRSGGGGKGQGGHFGRQARGFAAPIGGFPKQSVPTKPAEPAAEGSAPAPVKPKRSVKERKRGFTLLEMLVVIGIIVLLASLVLAVSSSVIRASEERTTRNTLEVLNAATEEYERSMDRRVSYQSTANGGSPMDNAPLAANALRYDVVSAPTVPPIGSGVAAWSALGTPYSALIAEGLPAYSTTPFKRTTHLIWALTQSPSSGALMQKLPDSIFRGVKPAGTSAGFTTVRHCVDSWDTPIIAVFPGREANSNGYNDPVNNIDADGTIKCDSETATAQNGGLGVSCKSRKILWVSAGNDSRFTIQSGSTYVPSTDNLYSYEP